MMMRSPKTAISPLSAFPLFAELIKCDSLQRLKKIRFLGAIEYFDKSHETAGSRFDHTIRTAEMTMAAASAARLPHQHQLLAAIHALLHDIGHGPLSHSSEQYFQNRYGLNHHVRFLKILSDETSDVVQILRKHGTIDSYRTFVSSPNRFPVVASFFFGPLNVDTIEGITRAAKYFGLPVKVPPDDLLRFIAKPKMKDLGKADEFWELKSKVYSESINSPLGTMRDGMVTEILLAAGERVSQTDFLLTDDQFERRFGGSIASTVEKHRDELKVERTVSKRIRIFEIDSHSVPRTQTQLSRRYSHRTLLGDKQQ